jgi:hypothetical protein
MEFFNPRNIINFTGLIKNSYPYWQYYVNGINKTESNDKIYSNEHSITISTKENNYVKKAHNFQLILSILSLISFLELLPKIKR